MENQRNKIISAFNRTRFSTLADLEGAQLAPPPPQKKKLIDYVFF